MTTHAEPSPPANGVRKRRSLRPGRREVVGVLLLLVIWVGMPLVSEGTGLRFGLGYRAFFTVMLLLGIGFFWFLGKEHVRGPSGAAGAMGALSLVTVVTVGILVGAGIAYPQFPVPATEESGEALTAAQRGEALFWSSGVGCFRCHQISGTGGIRGPDLTEVAARAGSRVPGLSAEGYLAEKIAAGGSYAYTVPEYVPMMPQYSRTLAEEELQELLDFLLSLGQPPVSDTEGVE
ncbi:MAG: c-type cytochrome [Dehalococcoidia bacterium]